MTQYLVAIHLPDDFDASSVDKAMERDIDELNEEMEASSLWRKSELLICNLM